MAIKSLKIAVISDLHCHPEREKTSENNTLLFTEKLRSPSNEHPVEDLLDVIGKEEITVDLVLSPGDFTHQSDKQGFVSGWSFVIELSRALNSTEVIATIGNHDIDTRQKYSAYSFDIPKKIRQNFPMKEDRLSLFWDKGYTIIEETDYQLLVINSAHFHTHMQGDSEKENPIVKGKVDLGQVEEIGRYLATHSDDSRIKIAMCHHHPIKHARNELGEHDFVENGEELMAVLGQHKFDLVIHGHKHDPWLRYYIASNGYQIPILSSGSFSATNQILWINKFNYFHLLEITKVPNSPANGTIKTYTFRNKMGWKVDREDGFYPYTGFGYTDNLDGIIQKIRAELERSKMCRWDDILLKIPEINNLTPDRMELLESTLSDQNIYLNSKIGLKPKHIYQDEL